MLQSQYTVCSYILSGPQVYPSFWLQCLLSAPCALTAWDDLYVIDRGNQRMVVSYPRVRVISSLMLYHLQCITNTTQLNLAYMK
jgi:hypothetical protein